MRIPLVVYFVALILAGATAKKSKKTLKALTPGATRGNIEPAAISTVSGVRDTAVPAVPVGVNFAAPPAAAPSEAAVAPSPSADPPAAAPVVPAIKPEDAKANANTNVNSLFGQEPAASDVNAPAPSGGSAQTNALGTEPGTAPDEQAAKQAPPGAPASPVPASGSPVTAQFAADPGSNTTAYNGNKASAKEADLKAKEAEAQATAADDQRVTDSKNIKVPNKIVSAALDAASTPEHSAGALDDEKVTFPNVIKKSLVGLQGLGKTSTKEIMEVLETHFFTGKKEDSIWALALEESETKLGLEFDERSLFDMQGIIKKIYRKMLECEMPNFTNDEKAQCILGVLEFIDDGLSVFGVLRMNDQEQAKMMLFNMAFKVMSINVLQIVKNIAENGTVNDLKAIKYLLDIGEDLYDGLKKWTDNTINWRLDAVDQPQVCNVQQVMWEEFTVGCTYKFPKDAGKSRARRDLGSYRGIGGNSDLFARRYKAKVLDKVTGEEVFSQTVSTDKKNSKEAVIAKLVKDATDSRNKYLQILNDDLKKFYGERTMQVHKEITKLWEKKKNKLKDMQEKIKNHHLI